MDLRVLKNFLKIAELENVTQASKELNVAQPHLTRQIKALEEELGIRLFMREKKRLHITDEGKFLKQQTEQIFELLDKTEQQIREMQSQIQGTLFIGAIESVAMSQLPVIISDFKQSYPDVKYNIWSANSSDVAERVEKGLLDLAIVREPFDKEKFEYIHLFDEKWAVFFGKENIFTQKSSDKISLRELSNTELLVPAQRVEEIERWFSEKKLKADIKCAFSPIINGIELIKQEIGVAILPESIWNNIYHKDIYKKELAENKITEVSLIWKKDIELSVISKKFLEFIKNRDFSIRGS